MWSDLTKTYPNLYKHPIQFRVGDGWAALLWELSARLESEILKQERHLQKDMYATLIKEKYGSLNFHMNYATNSMYRYIDEATDLSEQVCEFCGNKGSLREDRYVACEEHRKTNVCA